LFQFLGGTLEQVPNPEVEDPPGPIRQVFAEMRAKRFPA
jgi:hypothetical protein